MKKSFYIFLASLLGMILFILLQRSLFLLAYLIGVDVLSADFSRLDYGTFMLASFLGLWYGIWVGLYWYKIVYEEASSAGFLRSLFRRSAGNSPSLSQIQQGSTWNLEDLMKAKAKEYDTTLEPRLEVFESNTIAFSATVPMHAREIHGKAAVVKTVRPKRVVKRTVKKSVK